VASGEGVPLGIQFASASPAEVKLLEATLDDIHVPDAPWIVPDYVVADRGYDADWLRDALENRGMELVCPHRRGRKRPSRQDGRTLRRYKRRWVVERTFAWLGNFRRLLVRHERLINMFRAFVHVACILIALRQF
jgi:transposase